MLKFWRAALVSAAATATIAAGWRLLSTWSERTVQSGGEARTGRPRSREEIVEDLSDDEQQQLLEELGRQL